MLMKLYSCVRLCQMCFHSDRVPKFFFLFFAGGSVDQRKRSHVYKISINPLRHIQLKMRDPFGAAKQKKREEMANQYDDVASAAKEKLPLQNYKYIECTQQVMPFTYTSQHSKVRKVKKQT